MRYWVEKTERAQAANQLHISFTKPFSRDLLRKRKDLKHRFDAMIMFSQVDAWVCNRRKIARIKR